MDVVGAVSRDAVIVIPGIMGSSLVDVETRDVLWGLDDAELVGQRVDDRAALRRLAVTDDERAGRTGRVRAGGLLRFPAFAPVLKGFEPYTNCCRASDGCSHIRMRCASSRTTGGCPWNTTRRNSGGGRSAPVPVACAPRGQRGREGRAGRALHGRPGRPVLQPRARRCFRRPYDRHARHAVLRLRQVGVHPELWTWAFRFPASGCASSSSTCPACTTCCRSTAVSTTVRPPGGCSQGHRGIDGDPELAADSLERHTRLMAGEAGSLRLLIGVEQPTMQSLSMRDGV